MVIIKVTVGVERGNCLVNKMLNVLKVLSKSVNRITMFIVSGRLFQIDAATNEKALAHLAFFELIEEMMLCEDDCRSHVGL